ncbi:MAG TPA: large conductance mechanosensitive channel protein MscL [Candidatus Saccharimonadales bacterium]|nr:large conductance mechanosensitive channel protein MscL [Candidatus Saccharimonadales bacterium]
MTGFKAFLMRGNLVQLAVAFVMGVAFAAVIQSLVAGLFTPLIAAIIGKPDFANLFFTVNHSKFLYGAVVNALLTFVLVALVLFFAVIVPYQAVVARTQRQAARTTKECPECLSEIPIKASRCAFCTSPQPEVS